MIAREGVEPVQRSGPLLLAAEQGQQVHPAAQVLRQDRRQAHRGGQAQVLALKAQGGEGEREARGDKGVHKDWFSEAGERRAGEGDLQERVPG